MDESLRHINPNPTLTSNFISRGLFLWCNPLLKKGYKEPLQESDLYNVCPSDSSEYLGNKLEREWINQLSRQTKGEKPSLLRALFNTFGVQYLLVGFVVLLEESTKIVQPLLLGGLIHFFTPSSPISKFEAWMYALGVSLCAIVLAISHHPYFFCVQMIGMRMRVACCSLMYKKCLRLSNKAMGETTTGQIVNLMSNDVNRFDQAVIFLHFLWVGPLQAVAVLVILWRELGPSVLAGFFVLLLLIPVQGFMGKWFSKLRQKTAIHTDERVKVMNEIISGMRVIKMYCWEKPFGELVEKIRRREAKVIRWALRAQACMITPSFTSAKLMIVATFTALVTTGGTLTAYRTYFTVCLLHAVMTTMTYFIPRAIQYVAEGKIVILRLEKSYLSPMILFLVSTSMPFYLPNLFPNRERRVLWRIKQLTAYTSSVWLVVHRLLYYALTVGVVIGQSWASLRPASLYKATPLLFLVAYNLVGCVFEAVRSQGEWYAACTRIQKFLLLEDIGQSPILEKTDIVHTDDQSLLQLESITAKWEGNTSETNTLKDISLRVEPGQLIAIIGPVGAGKSSLLMAILGELLVQKGEVKVTGSLAYVSQQPWIFSGSVRQNIVFGGVFDKARYDRVINVSALRRDFEIMPQGDATLIGDRGVSLSGGQRARVSLARALYMDADIYLLDDPLSAVDSAVGRHIFEKCIVKHLKNKPRILVTHQVQFLPVADTIYIFKEGRINGHGTFDELSHSGVDFSELLKRPDEEKPSMPVPQNINPRVDGLLQNCEALGSTVSVNTIVDDYEPEAVQLPEVEERASGTVGYRVYIEYFKAGAGIFKFILLVLVNILAQLLYVGSDWWLSRWSNQEEDKYAAMEKQRLFLAELNITDFSNSSSISSNITIPCVDSHFNIYIFTGIIVAMFLFSLARALLFFRIAVDASQELHNRMFAHILRVPVSFFDTNPVGRILNRFSKDIGHMDDLLPVTFFDFIQCFLLIIGIVLVAEIVNPYVIVPTIPLIILFVLVRKYYLHTSRSIKRLESTSRSPVFSYLSATLQGLHTIRSMRMEEKFMEEFDAYQDKHSEAWFLFLATSRWLAVRLDWLCALFVTAVTVCSVLAADSMNAGLVGLSITYTMTLMGMFQWGVRQSAEVENQMISVERVLEYTCLPQEAGLESDPDKKPPPSWPENGAITGKDVSLRYSSDGPFVLKNLNFVINGREKIGIVGRTGAGKSSFVTTLFRTVEPQGCLLIDDINIQEIGLHDLRSSISIIPQDPVLFTGSLRQNLDPFHKHNDVQLWRALEEVKLKDQIRDIPEGLSVEVSEGGVNYSVGQRQLICLARAILGNSRILLIDEATANVDPVTDELIQKTLRTKFSDCTVLTIAHRLHTIMDSDRIMVLDMGQIVEFDQPYTLLFKGQGFFYDMAQQTGKTEFGHLLEIARMAAKKSELSPVITNGIIMKALRSVTVQENMMGDNSSRSSDSDTTGIKYGLDDIEEITQLIDNVIKDEINENVDEEMVENVEDENSKQLPSSQPVMTESRDQQSGVTFDLEKKSSLIVDNDDERLPLETDTLLDAEERPTYSQKEPNNSIVFSKDENKNIDDENEDDNVDENQVLLKTGSSKESLNNWKKNKFDDTIDV